MTTARRRRRPPSQPFATTGETSRPENSESPPAAPSHPDAATANLIGFSIDEAEYQDADDLPIRAQDRPAPVHIDPRLLNDGFDAPPAQAPLSVRPTTPPVRSPATITAQNHNVRAAQPAPDRQPLVAQTATPPAPASVVDDFESMLDEIVAPTQSATTDFDLLLDHTSASAGDLHIADEEEPALIWPEAEPLSLLTDHDESASSTFSSTTDEDGWPEPASLSLLRDLNHDSAVDNPDSLVLFDDEPEDQQFFTDDAQAPSLDSNAALWARLGETDDDEELPPMFAPANEPAPISAFGRRPEPTPIDEDEINRLRKQQPRSQAPVNPTNVEEDVPVPLAVDEQPTPAGKTWHPAVHVAARQGTFAGANALSLISPTVMNGEVDELNHALGAFADLERGQKGFVRLSIRNWPEFKGESSQWLAAKRLGQDPEGGKGGLAKGIGGWVGYFFRHIWFLANASSNHLGGSVPPMRPGQQGNVKPLTASQVSDDEKQAWKDAEQKARDTAHFEVDLRVAAVGKNEDAQELERIVEETAAGFDVYTTPHQQLVWTPADPYDTCIGFMGATLKSAPALALSAAELGELARVPDDRTRPQGVKIKRSNFKQIPLENPLFIDDPYNPPPGFIPLGVMNARSEDAKVFGMRNSELDQHMFYSGRTGTGKSELMKWLVFGVAKDTTVGHGFPIVIIDPHGALSEDLLNMLVVNCPERIKDIVFCDLSDPEYPVALNPLDIHSRDQIEPTVASVMEMLAKQMNLSASGAPRAVVLAQQALTALCYANLALRDPETKCTMLNVVTFFIDAEFRRLVMEFCDNISVQETFDPEKGPYEQMSDKQQTEFSMPIIRAFATLGSSDSFSAVFSAGENRLDFGQLIGEGKIVVVKLARYSHQAALGEFVGSLILPWLLSSMDDWGRKKDPETGEVSGSGCRIFVDEAPTLFGPTSSVPQLLAEARKWNLGLIAASQFLHQFDKSIIDSMLANTATKIALALELSSARVITGAIAGTSNKVTAGDIAELPNYHYYGNILLPGADGSGRGGSGPFSAACLPVIKSDLTADHKRLRDQVRARSRELVANRADEVVEKRRYAVENLKGALGELLRERIENGQDALGGHTPGGNYALDLDDPNGQAWGGWN